ncbi:MAG: CcoQ/FixQ family Cbb3-type cytochrome c oxidase assembly chaperone [Bacteroidetes bacterium]|nr:CcoQ/FixQ family Cbb3-type cytochrome c oxidase assembly chaperone [Bacteroidota bacterium]MBX7044766.1 CcoQ/FixQ family Cbb3-type cytochrome c oxidase assembly chaperone [Ignavibacteria bacterium]
MFNEILTSIEGIEIYPVFSLIIFFVFFICLAVWVLKADKKYLEKMSELPFEK